MNERLIVDPGFVNHRKAESVLGTVGTEIFNSEIARIPASMPEWKKNVTINHIYSKVLLDSCKVMNIKTLEELLSSGCGQLFCSNVKTLPNKDIYDKDRVIVKCEKIENLDFNVELHLSTGKISSDTLKSKMHNGGEFTVIGLQTDFNDKTAIFEPLLIGFPYIQNIKTGELMWKHYSDVYQVHLEDFDEFSKVKQLSLPASFDDMKKIKESVFKECLGKLLNESVSKDWGGETSDFFTSHLHIEGVRVKAAFLLKGPAKFSPMTLNHLGKNNDQILRLTREPADILIVQHCHDITPSVLETLQVFATQPSNPRRYCLIDGRESLRFLEAYNLKQWALEQE